jgi:hypothetical protein
VRTVLCRKYKRFDEFTCSRIVDTWFYEVIAMIFSLMCFTGIIAALIVYDDKPAPGFSYGLTLNAIISLLAAASKSSLIFVIAECIGQLKWLWFYQPGEKKTLDEMQLFDDASRGPMGSISVIWRHRSRSLASLGAVITVLAFAFDPFMQQVISYPIKNTVVATNSSEAVVKRATSLVLESFSDDELESIVYPGQWADNVDFTATCPSGNCTWPEFQSVEICHQCDDATAAFSLKCPRSVFNTSDDRPREQEFRCEIHDSLSEEPLGYLVASTSEDSYWDDLIRIDIRKQILWKRYCVDYASTNWSEITFAGLRNPQYVVIHMEVVLPDDANLTGISPLENMGSILRIGKVDQCAFALCSRTNQVWVTNGIPSVIKSAPDYGEGFYVNGSTGKVLHGISAAELGLEERERIAEWVQPCWKAGTGGPPARLTQLAGSGTWGNTTELAFCGIDDYWRLTTFTDGSAYWLWKMQNKSQWVNQTEYHDSTAAKVLRDGLEKSMSNIAASLNRAALLSSNQSVYGTVFQGETYVSVNWIWILLSTALVLLSVCFLLLTILANRLQRLHLWKSSILAVLFHGLDEVDFSDDEKRVDTVRQMERAAEDIRVRLKRSSRPRGLVLDQT